MSVRGDARLAPANGVHARDFEGEIVILDLTAGQYYGLDEIGAAIWERLVAGRSPAEIAEDLSRAYDVERGELETDVCALAGDLVARGLLIARAS